MKIKVLFVCLGNICRSPSAEAIFRGYIEKKDLGDIFEIDSAGTSGYHQGEPADARMRRHASKRGYNLTSLSRKFDPATDFDHFDIIIAMDHDNMHDLRQMARNKEDEEKLFLMTDFSSAFDYSYVPDPYYGGDQGFELVIDLLEDSSIGLFNHLKPE
ncbi:MAG: low molecular weight protein-tyrosine-phosphatase [Bacteroidales bacterium]|jgi:protein-tyrosine phosphatase|nr:low molecular weight protein-tyrosine-phosphatase [Bacteroidales bacterium]